MSKYFNIPFATSGDKTTIPDTDPGGNVNYTQGYTSDYELEQGVDPSAKDIPRQSENQFKFDVTDAIKEIQEYSILNYRVDVDYPVGAVAVGSDGTTYKVLIANGPSSSVVDPVGDLTGTWITFITNYSEMKTGRKNAIINGNFDIWQRDTSQTSLGYGSDDRWFNNNVGSTKTHSQQSFTPGQIDVPDEPRFYSRTVVSSVAGASNNVLKSQRIEGVRTFAGQTVTLSFYAKADSAKNIATEFVQDFGSGGSPSSDVSAIGVTTHSLTTSFTKFEATVSIPSISGKTIGTNDDDYLEIIFWFDAGSNFDSRTNTLGQQSGTFDIAQVQLESGNIATGFESRLIGEEQSLCERFYQKSYQSDVFPGDPSVNNSPHFISDSLGNLFGGASNFQTRMRASPTFVVYKPSDGTINVIEDATESNPRTVTNIEGSQVGLFLMSVSSAASSGAIYQFHYTADAEL